MRPWPAGRLRPQAPVIGSARKGGQPLGRSTRWRRAARATRLADRRPLCALCSTAGRQRTRHSRIVTQRTRRLATNQSGEAVRLASSLGGHRMKPNSTLRQLCRAATPMQRFVTSIALVLFVGASADVKPNLSHPAFLDSSSYTPARAITVTTHDQWTACLIVLADVALVARDEKTAIGRHTSITHLALRWGIR
jgi:hypothetical protein